MVSYNFWRLSTGAPSYSAGLHSLEARIKFASEAVLVEILPSTSADVHEIDRRTWELQLEDQLRVIRDLVWILEARC